MLSSENPPPSPPPPSEKLKSVSEKRVEVDLLSSSDKTSHTRFSIRDYVFTARSKDIKTHWPFSPENLQLCLKNGVEEVLPPFETLETVKNPPPFVKRADEHTANLVSGPISKNAIVDLDPVNNFKPNSPEQEDDEEYCSDVNPIPFQTKSPFPEAKKPVTTVRATDKGKKCRLIVKLGNNNISEPKSSECDFSEAMASSKVCPVCKTFSSSSNTTLNAHIDQCLSGESKVKQTENPKVMIKHRITKPRKVRLMADIYETALCCTLEDLDRRNGTNWASNVSVPPLDQENDQENNDKESSLIISENKKEEGAVYIDSNGVKVRILSKLSDMNPKNNGEDDCEPVTKKLLEIDKASKICPIKKKKHLVQRENIPRYPEELKFPPEENERDDSTQPLEAAYHEHEIDQMKSNGSGLIKQWKSSKRTSDQKKKIRPDQKSHHPEKNVTAKNSRIKSNQLPSLDGYHDSGLPISTSDNDNINPDPLPASESQKIKESMDQQPCLTNRAGYSLFDSGDFDYDKETKNNHMMLLRKRNFKRRKSSGISFQNGKEFKKLSTSGKIPMFKKHMSFSESKKCLGSTNLVKSKKSSANGMQNDKAETTMEKDSDSDHSSFDHQNRVLRIQKRRRGLLNSRSPKQSNASSESDEFEHNINSFARDNRIPGGMSDSSNAVELETHDEFASGLISKIACGGEPLTAYDAYDESLAYEEEMLSAGKALVSEVNVNQVEEGNYFVDVDPITIPGPPGSFLPSPGRMGSEELQGNSSLTSCRVHSSGNERALVDRMDSSDSPISGSSFVSNSIAFRTHATPNMIGQGRDRPNPISVFPVGGDSESPSPSTPNHILRLMGKNLMVANKEPAAGDENAQRYNLPSDFSFRTPLSSMISTQQRFVSSMDFHGYATRNDFEKAHTTPSINPHPYLAGNEHMGARYYYQRHENPISGYQTMLYNGMNNNGNSMTWSHAPEPSGVSRSAFYFSGGVSLPTKFS